MISERRLERHAHLEKVVTDFFKNILNLEEVPFDEAERIAEPVGSGEGNYRIQSDSVMTNSRYNVQNIVVILVPDEAMFYDYSRRRMAVLESLLYPSLMSLCVQTVSVIQITQ